MMFKIKKRALNKKAPRIGVLFIFVCLLLLGYASLSQDFTYCSYNSGVTALYSYIKTLPLSSNIPSVLKCP